MSLPQPAIYISEEYLDTDKYQVHLSLIKEFKNAKKNGVEKSKVGVYLSDKPRSELDKGTWEHIPYSNLLEARHPEESIDYMIINDFTSKLHHFNTPNKVEVEKDTYTHIAMWVSKKLKTGGIMYTSFSKVGSKQTDFQFMRELTNTMRMEGFLCAVVETSKSYDLYAGKV